MLEVEKVRGSLENVMGNEGDVGLEEMERVCRETNMKLIIAKIMRGVYISERLNAVFVHEGATTVDIRSAISDLALLR